MLNKPDRLTPEEFGIIQSHTLIGNTILSGHEELRSAADVALQHHERYDGEGYPAGLAGEAISKHARIVSIADAFDAMRSDRVYRKALSPERIRKELEKGKGRQFDPDYLHTFLDLLDAGTFG